MLFYSRNYNSQWLYYLQQSGEYYEFDENIKVSWYGDDSIKYIRGTEALVHACMWNLAQQFNVSFEEIPYPLAVFSQALGLNDSGLDGLYGWTTNINPHYVINDILHPLDDETIYKTMNSSGTLGQGVSKIYLDKENASSQTKVLTKIVSSVLGNKRLPMLIIDSQSIIKDNN